MAETSRIRKFQNLKLINKDTNLDNYRLSLWRPAEAMPGSEQRSDGINMHERQTTILYGAPPDNVTTEVRSELECLEWLDGLGPGDRVL